MCNNLGVKQSMMHSFGLLGVELGLEHGLSIFNLFVVNLIGLLEEEVGQVFDGVLRHLLAQLDEPLREERHEVVHEVLPDGLRARVEQISLLLLDELSFSHILELFRPPLLLLLLLLSLEKHFLVGTAPVVFLFILHDLSELVVLIVVRCVLL